VPLPPLSEAEIARRVPVWTILAETILDTAFDEGENDRMASELVRSGYSAAELQDIYRREIAPAFWFNLASPADEWAG
jgi:hypothetical protein